MSYSEFIVEATGCPVARAGEVEEILRGWLGALDNLDARTFRREARRAWAAQQVLDRQVDRMPLPEARRIIEEAVRRVEAAGFRVWGWDDESILVARPEGGPTAVVKPGPITRKDG